MADTVEMIRKRQARHVYEHVKAHPGLNRRQVADAVLNGRSGILRTLEEEGWIQAYAKQKGTAFIWVPRRSANGRRLRYYGFMVTTKVWLVQMNVQWSFRNIATRTRRLVRSSAVELLRKRGGVEAAQIDGLAGYLAGQQDTWDALFDAAEEELQRQIERQ